MFPTMPSCPQRYSKDLQPEIRKAPCRSPQMETLPTTFHCGCLLVETVYSRSFLSIIEAVEQTACLELDGVSEGFHKSCVARRHALRTATVLPLNSTPPMFFVWTANSCLQFQARTAPTVPNIGLSATCSQRSGPGGRGA